MGMMEREIEGRQRDRIILRKRGGEGETKGEEQSDGER